MTSKESDKVNGDPDIKKAREAYLKRVDADIEKSMEQWRKIPRDKKVSLDDLTKKLKELKKSNPSFYDKFIKILENKLKE